MFKLSRLKLKSNRMVALLAILSGLMLSQSAVAATDLVNVYFLPIEEAASIARSQLSDSGKVAMVPSQHILIIDDDSAHINKAKALLKRLDRAPGQYTAYVSIEDVSLAATRSLQTSAAGSLGQLSGGWLQVQLQSKQSHASHRQSFQLRVSQNEPGSIETGTIQSFSRTARLWLSGYGLLRANAVELVPITSGFHITVLQMIGNAQLRVRIVPWMQRTQARVEGQQEMLIDLGRSNSPATPPANVANMRLNAQPVMIEQPVIEIAGAATELIIPVDQSVTIAAANREAKLLGGALLSRFSRIGKRQFVIHLRVAKN